MRILVLLPENEKKKGQIEVNLAHLISLPHCLSCHYLFKYCVMMVGLCFSCITRQNGMFYDSLACLEQSDGFI